MKLSKYNHFFCPYDQSESLLINYSTGRLHIFAEQADQDIREYFNSHKTSKNIEAFLVNKGYLIEDEVDEEYNIQLIESEIREQKDVLSLVFILTERCNLRCVYCCEEHLNTRMTQDLQDKIIEFVKQNIHKYKLLKVEWFGGEPLLCMDIIEYMSKKFLKICHENNVRYFAVTSTNGYLLNLANLKKLKDLHVFAYQITVDGLRKTHDAQRMRSDGVGSWDIIVQNLKEIRDHFNSNLVSFLIRTNVTYPIYNEIDEYMKFLSDEFGNDKRFSFIWRIAEDWGRIEEKDMKILCGIEEYRNVMKKAGHMKLRNRYLAGTLKPGERACEAAKKNSLIFFPTGIIGKCERNVEPEKSHIGNIDELLKFPEKYLNRTLTRNKEGAKSCKHCEKYAICLGKACPFIEDVQCGYEMKDIDFLLDCIMKCDDTCSRITRF